MTKEEDDEKKERSENEGAECEETHWKTTKRIEAWFLEELMQLLRMSFKRPRWKLAQWFYKKKLTLTSPKKISHRRSYPTFKITLKITALILEKSQRKSAATNITELHLHARPNRAPISLAWSEISKHVFKPTHLQIKFESTSV